VNRRDDHADEVEWLDVGRPVPPGAQRATIPRWRWWYPVAALALVLLAISALRQHNSSSAKQRSVASPTTAGSTLPASDPAAAPAASPITAPVTILGLGHPLLDVPGTWQLFGRGPNVVVRIDLAAGRVTVTTVPDLASTGPVWFVAGPDEAIVRPLDNVPGYLVPDTQPAQLLGPPFNQGGPLLAGPDAEHVWVQTENDTTSVLTLVDFDGRSSGKSITLPPNTDPASSDGAGYPVITGTGGAYDARPAGVDRITSGTLLAVGPTSWLSVECDVRDHCAITVTDRATGVRRTLATPVDDYQSGGGLISPDGRTAALLGPQRNGISAIYLLDLDTGVAIRTRVSIDLYSAGGSGNFVWSPDSRYLFAADGDTSPAVVDRATGSITRLAVTVPPITQVALRS
jgi:hypothetical protein